MVFEPALTSVALSTANRQRSHLEQFLRFHLVPDTTVMLSVSQLTEVLTIPLGQIIPIPHMSPWVMGVYNWRGEVLWMVDLGHLVGLTPTHQQTLTTPAYRAAVLQPTSAGGTKTAKVRSQMLGLVVTQVEDIEWCDPAEIQSPPAEAVTQTLAPFLRGYWLKPNGDAIVTLDGEAILSAMPTEQ